MKRLIALLSIAALLTGCSLVSPGTPKSADIKAATVRVVQARLYDGKQSTLSGRSVDEAAQTIRSLKPTWVSGLIKLDEKDDLNVAQVVAYTRVRDAVKEQSPACLFDLVLDANQYATADAVTAKMKQISASLKVDVWYFEDLSKAFEASPDMVNAAIEYAHANGQLIGGDVSDSTVPQGIDFAALDEGGGTDKAQANAAKLVGKTSAPVLLHMASASAKGGEKKDAFLTLDSAGRAALLEALAKAQSSTGFRLMYPVYCPVNANKQSYDAGADGVLKDIISLMSQYNQ